jgi:prevent-host-death family protein
VYTRVHMEEVGIRDLRFNAAGMVRRASAGERIIVTVNGRPLAQLGPIDSGPAAPTLAELVARGLLRGPASSERSPSPNRVELWAGMRLDRMLSEVRGR